ncbi:flocculation protein FLO11-like [Huso huso]|uniref:Flocculation protein FLO11-like n=1 Tax=Huso huso TaxID=61971 RepID=A0ABR0ZM54_HUSHU
MRMGSAFFVNMRCPVTETTTGKSTKPAVVCRNTSMMVELPEGSLKPVQVIGKDNRPVDISDAFIKCGYLLVERGGKINLTAVYTACDVKIVNKNYTLMIIYTTASGKREMVQMSCPTRAVQPTAHTTRKPVTTEKSTKPTLPPTAVCKASSMTVELPSESLQVLLLNLSNEWVDINAAPSYCNYSLVQGRGRRNFFTTPYKACDVRIQSGNYILKLSYITPVGREYLDIRCPIGAGDPTTSSAGDPKTTSSAGDLTTSSAGDPTGSAPILVFCNSSSIKVELPGGPPEKVKVMGEYFKTNLQDHLCQLGSPKKDPFKKVTGLQSSEMADFKQPK